jgi:hypothetical protein
MTGGHRVGLLSLSADKEGSMSRGFRVNVASKRVVFPVVMLVSGLLSLAFTPGAFACSGGVASNLVFIDRDAYVAQADPDNPHGSGDLLRIGYNQDNPHHQFQTYMHFTGIPGGGLLLPTIPPGCTPLSAYLGLGTNATFSNPNVDIDDMTDADVKAQRAANNAWTESIKWSNKPGGTGSYTVSNPYYGALFGYYDVTGPVLELYDGAANNGIVLSPLGSGTGSGWNGINGAWWSPPSRESNHAYVTLEVFYD